MGGQCAEGQGSALSSIEGLKSLLREGAGAGAQGLSTAAWMDGFVDADEFDNLWGEADRLYQLVQSETDAAASAADAPNDSRCSRNAKARLASGEAAAVAGRREDVGIGIYKVVHSPKVVLRNQPNLFGQVVGVLKHGDFIEACARSGDWLRLRNAVDDIDVNRRVPSFVTGDTRLGSEKEWVLQTHPELGRLLSFVAGSRNLPQETLALPAPEPSTAAHRCVYVVVYERVVVRQGPSMDEPIIGCRRRGEYINTVAIRGGWVQVNLRVVGGVGPGKPDGEEMNVEGWCLLHHHELGPLLALHAQLDDS